MGQSRCETNMLPLTGVIIYYSFSINKDTVIILSTKTNLSQHQNRNNFTQCVQCVYTLLITVVNTHRLIRLVNETRTL